MVGEGGIFIVEVFGETILVDVDVGYMDRVNWGFGFGKAFWLFMFVPKCPSSVQISPRIFVIDICILNGYLMFVPPLRYISTISEMI